MKIYLAASFAAQARMREIREWLHSHTPYRVVSTWLDETENDASIGVVNWPTYGLRDLGELKTADGLILDTLTPSTTGASEVEWGLALGRAGLRIRTIVGPVRNVFHTLAMNRFEDWDEAKRWLRTNGN